MKPNLIYDALIIGGGLAGLTTAIQLSKAGIKVLLIEKNEYPFHRVCGEYISNEVRPFLSQLGLDLERLHPAEIKSLTVTSPSGTILNAPLDMGGFGISRYTLDNELYKLSLKNGCTVLLNTTAESVTFSNNQFTTKISTGEEILSNFVFGTYGKRSSLDRTLNRKFFTKRSPYIGVKYHIKTDFPVDQIALHNFKDGYCGLSAIENKTYCLCYLTTRENLKKAGSINALEKTILSKNIHLKAIFENATFLFDKPEVINEISFETKSTIENHILMIGDTAGMIAPLCGNGMSMAIHSSKLLSNIFLKYYHPDHFDRAFIEEAYNKEWKTTFTTRLYIGKKIQNLFGQTFMTELVVKTLQFFPPIVKWLIKKTHGKTI